MNFIEFKELLKEDRSVRRFHESHRISEETLESLVELTRYCASGRNLQPLKYRICSDPKECAGLFENLKWAGYYGNWSPAPGERPAAYLLQCLDLSLTEHPLCDEGIQLQAITLGARALGIGGCIIKSFNKNAIAEKLNIPQNMDIRYVLALGHPAEETVITDMDANGDIKYFRDASDRQCVPKRALSDLIIR